MQRMIVIVERYILSQRTSKWVDSKSTSLAIGVFVMQISTDSIFRMKRRVKVIVRNLEKVRGRLP